MLGASADPDGKPKGKVTTFSHSMIEIFSGAAEWFVIYREIAAWRTIFLRYGKEFLIVQVEYQVLLRRYSE